MQRSIADTLPTLAAPQRHDAVVAAVTQGRDVPRWAFLFGFWTLIVLAYSTRGEVRVGPYQWVSLSWVDALKAAAAQWYPWGLLSVAIYWVNRQLPVASDALLRRMLLHVPLSIAFTVAYTYLNQVAANVLGAPDAPQWLGETLIDTVTKVTYRQGTFVYWAVAMICVTFDYQRSLKDREVRTAGLERLLSEARLATLRSQLDPHFLFNTLNSISAYVESAPSQARLMLEQLGDLLRLSLDHAHQQEVPLERELTFVDRYIQLQLVRFAERLQVRVQADPEVLNAAVPTFLLQPLLENAIRHGTSKLSTAGVIELFAWRSGDLLHVRVRDNGPGLPRGWSLDRHRGIGLGNTCARLEQLYGRSEYSLDVAADDAQRTCVDITIPFRVA